MKVKLEGKLVDVVSEHTDKKGNIFKKIKIFDQFNEKDDIYDIYNYDILKQIVENKDGLFYGYTISKHVYERKIITKFFNKSEFKSQIKTLNKIKL